RTGRTTPRSRSRQSVPRSHDALRDSGPRPPPRTTLRAEHAWPCQWQAAMPPHAPRASQPAWPQGSADSPYRSQRGRSPSGASGGGGGCCYLPPSAHPCKPFASGRTSHRLQTQAHSYHLQRRHVLRCRILAIFSQDALPLLDLLICRTHQNLVTVSLHAHYYIPFRRAGLGRVPLGGGEGGVHFPERLVQVTGATFTLQRDLGHRSATKHSLDQNANPQKAVSPSGGASRGYSSSVIIRALPLHARPMVRPTNDVIVGGLARHQDEALLGEEVRQVVHHGAERTVLTDLSQRLQEGGQLAPVLLVQALAPAASPLGAQHLQGVGVAMLWPDRPRDQVIVALHPQVIPPPLAQVGPHTGRRVDVVSLSVLSPHP